MPRTEFQPGATNDHYHDTASVQEQAVVRMLGPFHVAHDDEGLDDNGIQAFEIDAGSIVISVCVLVTEAWDGAGTLNVAVGGEDWAEGNWWVIHSADNIDTVTNDANSGSFSPSATLGTPATVLSSGIAHTGPGAVVVSRVSDDETGEADIYAIVATRISDG